MVQNNLSRIIPKTNKKVLTASLCCNAKTSQAGVRSFAYTLKRSNPKNFTTYEYVSKSKKVKKLKAYVINLQE